MVDTQGRNQEFFWTEDISLNKGISVNISSTTNERKAPPGKMPELPLYALKSCIVNEKINP